MRNNERTLSEELKSVDGADYSTLFAKFRELSERYSGMPMSSIIDAYNAANGITNRGTVRGVPFASMYTPNPFIQNKRVKGIGTRPVDYTKDQVAEFLVHPDSSEKPLRAVEKQLEYTAYPMFHTRMVYQNLLTYHNYVAPHLADKEDTKRDDFWREWKLLEKLRKEIDPKAQAHELAGRALQYGKIFVTPRVSLDKVHNSVNYAFLQRLPSDWTKIVGFNNVSKYTVAFDMMYFCNPGTVWTQYGDLFEPFIKDWMGALEPAPVKRDKKVVYAKQVGVNMSAVKKAAADNVDAYYQNGRWFYWVTLPVDRVFPFEIDDTEENVLPPFAGLFIDMIQLSQMEQIQLEILQNPLVAILHGELETWDTKSDNTSDQYKVSDAGRRMFEALWYQMLTNNSTNGIGIFTAPFKNMKLEALHESPNATEIVSKGYADVMSKAGLTAVIPVSADARAGAVQVSFTIESQYGKVIYSCFERMMKSIIRKLNLKYEWIFKMFGDLASDKEREEKLRKEMTLGLLPAIIEYDAMKDMSLLDDIAISDAVVSSKVMERRLPLVSSYQAANKDGILPPHGEEGGRPQSEGVTSEGQEGDLDSPPTNT